MHMLKIGVVVGALSVATLAAGCGGHRRGAYNCDEGAAKHAGAAAAAPAAPAAPSAPAGQSTPAPSEGVSTPAASPN